MAQSAAEIANQALFNLPNAMDMGAREKRELSEVESDLLNSLAPSTPFSTCSGSSNSTSCTNTPEAQEQPAAEKKPVKKRKSWGQELPTPTTNLPPRKRAKTEAEKEQRRIERVLRNRAAAQSSRERKRKEVEALEDVKNNLADTNTTLTQENEMLRQRVEAVLAQNALLQQTLEKLKGQLQSAQSTPVNFEFNSSPTIPLLLTPVSITHDSFSSMSSDVSTPPNIDGTLDPSHLSTPSQLEEDPYSLTQHTAAMLCPVDLPCQLIGPSSPNPGPTTWIACSILPTLQDPRLERLTDSTTTPHTPTRALRQSSPSTLSSTSQKTMPPQPVCNSQSLSPTCALPRDATSSVRGLGMKTSEGLLSLWVASLDESEDDEAQNPAWACRKFVLGMGGYEGSSLMGKEFEASRLLSESIKSPVGI